MARGVGGGLGSVPQPELGQDGGDVVLDRPATDVEALGDR
jgi:hypothetical protein